MIASGSIIAVTWYVLGTKMRHDLNKFSLREPPTVFRHSLEHLSVFGKLYSTHSSFGYKNFITLFYYVLTMISPIFMLKSAMCKQPWREYVFGRNVTSFDSLRHPWPSVTQSANHHQCRPCRCSGSLTPAATSLGIMHEAQRVSAVFWVQLGA